MVFHERLAGGPGELAYVKSVEVEALKDAGGALTKSAILAEWRKILKVNYWPIFELLHEIFGRTVFILEKHSVRSRMERFIQSLGFTE